MSKRVVPVLITALALAACSAASSDHDVIAKTCVSDGGVEQVCDCLAKASVKRLEPSAVDAIVFGARGQAAEADKVLASLTPEQGATFRAAMEGILRECGAEDYLRP